MNIVSKKDEIYKPWEDMHDDFIEAGRRVFMKVHSIECENIVINAIYWLVEGEINEHAKNG